MLNHIRRLSQLVSITRDTISKIGTVLQDMDSKLVLETRMSNQSCARTML
jgi:hypothetical protein